MTKVCTHLLYAEQFHIKICFEVYRFWFHSIPLLLQDPTVMLYSSSLNYMPSVPPASIMCHSFPGTGLGIWNSEMIKMFFLPWRDF